MRRSSLLILAIALLSIAAPRPAHGDEFKLKDGSVIVGTVVGYQGDAFRVKTSYGYALVEKDKIVSIQLAGTPEPASEKKLKSGDMKAPAPEKPAPKATKAPSVENHPSVAKVETHSSPAAAAKDPDNPAENSSASSDREANADSGATAKSANATPASTSANAPPTTVASTAPAAPPDPQPIREKISGNTYINDSYEFQMYKPPDWQVMDGARSVLPGAVAAMGTDDQSTYLVVGQETSGKSSAAEIAATEKRLGDILVNFRPLSDERLTVSGAQVIAHRFRGSVDEHDWSGFMVFLPRGEKLYTIFGMTRADDDLVQIQENVIRRTIASFQFLPE